MPAYLIDRAPRRFRLLTWLMVGATALAAQTVSGQSITNLGVLQNGHHFSQGLAVSSNGAVVVGDSGADFFDDSHGILWTRAGGMADIGALPATLNTFAQGVNADGSVIVGSSYGDRDFAFRWTAAGGMQDLGTLPGAQYGADAWGVSADGKRVAGTSSTADSFHPFLWTSEQGMQDLGVLPGGAYAFGFAISANGRAVVGLSDAGGIELAFRWTPGRGMQALPSVHAGDPAAAFAVSASGSVIAGYSGNTAAIWRGNSVHDLGVLPGGTYSTAYAVSGNGLVVGGGSQSGAGGVAVIWTSALGMVDLNTYLPTLGFDLTGWSLEAAAGLSYDGSTIVGVGTYNGEGRGWVVDLDTPGHSSPMTQRR